MASLSRVVLMRQRVYDLLASAFRPPEPRSLARVLRDGPFTLEQLVAVAPFRALEEARALFTDLARSAEPGALLTDELAPEYARLFSPSTALPCESSYLRDGPAAGGIPASVRNAYRLNGFSASRSMPSSPDHITVELAFMAELCRRQFRALVEGSGSAADRLAEAQRQFLEEHLGRWGPPFAQHVRDRTTCCYYRAAALALPVWIGLDRGFLRTLRGPPGGSSG